MSHVRTHRSVVHRTVVGAVLVAALGLTAAPAGAAPAPESRAQFAESSMDVAARYEGTPYTFGGDSPEEGFDCSGYTQQVYAELGTKIPRTSQDQYDKAEKVGKDPKVGDLIFFHSAGGGSVYHAAIYAGKNRIWHSPSTGGEVEKTKIWTDSWTAGRYDVVAGG